MKNYIILHGSFSSPYANWFKWLFDELEKGKQGEECKAYVPHLPSGVGHQNYTNWGVLGRV